MSKLETVNTVSNETLFHRVIFAIILLYLVAVPNQIVIM